MPDDNEVDESSDVASENEYDEAENSKDEHDDEIMGEQTYLTGGDDVDGPTQAKKPKLDPKDPQRPRRKKARRACFACQRAHLTCGDERPCQRCIKRGLADACQDGVRKKAKYLHDAPPEALRPVLGPTYNPARNGGTSGTLSGSPTANNTSPSISGFYQQANTSPSYQMQYQPLRHTQMAPPPQEQISYNSEPSPISPTFQTPTLQRPVSMQSLAAPVSANDFQNQSAFSGPLFDPSNPALFNFDLEGLHFGNHYGALEFGMLNHMSSGATETPSHDNGSISQQGGSETFNTGNVFNNNMAQQYGQMYPQQETMVSDFVGIDRNPANMFDLHPNHPLPRAYAIETSSVSFASPSTDAQLSPQPSLGFDNSPTTTPHNANVTNNSVHNQQAHQRHTKRRDSKSATKFGKHSTSKRTRDPSSIYTNVNEPYSYTEGFHCLTAYIQRRFSPNATLKIAKSLASIRPSFISCTKTLNRQDLIFMEKCFQRTLFEYEGFMENWGTPTLVCRRTGEVAAVNKEFTLLTRWTKNILLGKEPNLNINTGKSSGQSSRNASAGNSGRAGMATPRIRSMEMPKMEEGRSQPIFLAELLDDDTVIEFYQDFSKLAFGDSRGYVTKLCKLISYQTEEGLEDDGKNEEKIRERKRKEGGGGTRLGGRVSKIDGENGIGRLKRDGKMDCAYCWTVKRDVFDIPMLIVMNFLPCIGSAMDSVEQG